MIPATLIGHTNARPVGEHPAETLFVAGPGNVLKRDRGWNVLEYEGRLCRVADRAGNPMIPLGPVTEDQMAGVVVVPSAAP